MSDLKFAFDILMLFAWCGLGFSLGAWMWKGLCEMLNDAADWLVVLIRRKRNT